MKFSVSTIMAVLLVITTLTVEAQDKEYNLDQDYGIAADGTVFLESDDAEVKIIGSDRFDVNVNVYHRVDVDGIEWGSEDEFKMNVKQRNGNLYIEEAERESKTFRIGSVEQEYRITVRVPKGVSVDIKGDDGNYEISDVGGAINMIADDSDVRVSNAGGEEFSFEIDDGSIRMDKGQGKLTVKLDDGEFRVDNGQFSEIDATGDDADLYVATGLSDGGTYYFGMDDGDLELSILNGGGRFDIDHDNADIETMGAFSKVSDEEEKTVYNLSGGNAVVEIESDDGDILLRK